MKAISIALVFAGGVSSILLSNCGILSAPVSLPAAVAENSNFSFSGVVVDQDGKSLEGVIVTRLNYHHFWMPLSGGKDIPDTIIRRADATFEFDDRGASLDFTFSKDGYQDASFRMTADNSELLVTSMGTWKNGKKFPAVMLSTTVRDADLAHYNNSISYDRYPVADAIALPNVATEGRSGDITYAGKDAQDPTIFPAGTLYITLGKEPPPAINSKGDVDPTDLDIPHHVTLHLPGMQSGFVRIEPRTGYHPITTSDSAPASGYVHELTFSRARLKEMRKASQTDIIEAHEYFFFRAGDRYGKGTFSWANQSGKPTFRFDLFIQPQPENRDLTTHKLSG